LNADENEKTRMRMRAEKTRMRTEVAEDEK
jgi:hypothetical protein